MMLSKNYALIGGVGVAVLAGALAFYGYGLATKTTTVIAANTSIPMNTPITPQDLETLSVPISFAHQEDAATNTDELVGKMLQIPVVQGQVITANMMSTQNNIEGVLTAYSAQKNEPGVLMEMTVSNVLESLAQAGQDVAFVIPAAQNSGSAPQLIAPIKILAVEAAPKQSSSMGSSGGGSATMLVFIPDSIFNEVATPLLANQVQIVLYPQGKPPVMSNAQVVTTTPVHVATVKPKHKHKG